MKRWICGIAVALAVVIAAVLVKNEYGRYLLAHANYGMQALITGQQEGTLDQENGVNLFIGSSMFRKGLDIQELDEGLQGDNYILSYNGTRAFQCYEELEYALEKGVKIRHLYVDLYAFAMSADPWVEDERLFLETDLPFKIRLWDDMEPYSESPLSDFWEMFVTSNNERLLMWPVDYAATNGSFLRGGSLSYDPGYGMEDFEGDSAVPDVEPAEMNRAQTGYLVKLIELCRSRKIPLTFIETPKYVSIMYEDSYVSLMKAYLEVLNRYHVAYCVAEDTAETCAEQIRDNDKAAIYSFETGAARYFEDWLHLSSDGRKLFSGVLAELLAGQASDNR